MAIKRAFTVYYDDESGELEFFKVADHFKLESHLLQADVYKDVRDKCEETRELYFKKEIEEANL